MFEVPPVVYVEFNSLDTDRDYGVVVMQAVNCPHTIGLRQAPAPTTYE